ncbi:MAG TPA: GNAT family protein [Pyrinomonadaceae bacterium]
MLVQPITLEGRRVRLEPMSDAHLGGLTEVGLDEELWRWTTTRIASPAEMRAYVEAALEDGRRRVSLPFVTVESGSGRVVGSTRFGNIDRENRKAEIGWTWIGRDWQRTPVNTEAKLLMLAHAFEVWRCVRVELKTDSLNERSRRAILRIGAKEEGTLRNHMITHTGRLRHSVFFSVIESEWPQVRADLETKLARVYSGG